MPSRSFIAVCVLLGLPLCGWLAWRGYSSRRLVSEAPAPIIDKQPVSFTRHDFDPSSPPADMPPLSPGENAECESDFLSNASVRGETQPSDATHATLTITQVRMTLQLKINIWVPIGATQHLLEHEEGHRQISEYYYLTTDKLAERIAATYIGKQIEITGADLNAKSNKMLQQLAGEITKEYNRQLDPGPTQLLYDSITDHSRNGVSAKDAVDHAIKNAAIEAPGPKNADQ